ncbi:MULTISPECIES: GNAT family N-acetyltransferase [Bacillales]|jgi:RimJ/RimL family protein N-acetyltransferase|uniref:Acetyltransferase n=1 Tax=Brevibacillus aydinogluensis TaxID=927786 RepID=A0AA48RG44_9BACL|nr:MULTISPECIES: GNAT family protein [Bacillales]REK63819.1 MAG: GNAT family N-acetyltransferase [Brevibacillus sp.]MBR8660422.1 GNAT family N-acetyltransferase [Brevibacillus sp. NL20B1]MDT3418052.1 RimJ/RimL family protein N-acetyltransferase [Brevibacillus aydinogluensis]NNV03332.1 N-acetyltransferase [Brevibacillus sp. MCWH]UFJ61830.1 GNAT family N-acetyltransferase [Anoxybacillus sediminis]
MNNQDTPTAPVRFLEGDRVYLRPIGLDDTDLYFRMLFDPEVRRLTGTQKSFTREQIYRYIEGKTQDPSSLLLLIALRETDEVIGDIALQSIDNVNRNANIRIAINSQEHQGRGLGTEAMRLLLDYAFGILNLHRIELNVFSYNSRAIRAYEKLGFQREGVQREALYYNHQYHDSIIMSILEDEYRAQHLKKHV